MRLTYLTAGLGRPWWWVIIGRRYFPQNGKLGVRLWWLARWRPLKLVKKLGPLYVTEDVMRQMR